MERQSQSFKFNEEFLQPSLTQEEIIRNLSTSHQTINKALTAKSTQLLQQQREILMEQMLGTDFSQKISDPQQNVNLESYMKERLELISKNKQIHFSYDITLTKQEIEVEKKLFNIRDQLLQAEPSIVTGFIFDNIEKLKNSQIYQALLEMPKPAVHHVHLTAAAPIDYLIKLTYNDFVYYNDRTMLFKVSRKGIKEDGFIAANTLRKHWESSQSFDSYLKDRIELGKTACASQESHVCWEEFQPKFILTCDLYNYYEHFEKILNKVLKVFIKQNVFIMELRHILGMIIDDDGKNIPLNDELEIFDRVVKKIKLEYPLFQCKLIICSLKIIGKDHAEKMIKFIEDTPEKYKYLIAGFDMVNEEDFVPPLTEFVKQMHEARERSTDDFPVILHAGESCDRRNENLYDAILLGTKRIGHGIQLIQHPHLMEICKERKICVECCPISNVILGYTLDMRCHPARTFLNYGVPVSISPDDPGFFGYEGVTLDFVMAFLAWELNLADLKKLCLNSLEYSIISDQDKIKLVPFFEMRWQKFLEFVKGKF